MCLYNFVLCSTSYQKMCQQWNIIANKARLSTYGSAEVKILIFLQVAKGPLHDNEIKFALISFLTKYYWQLVLPCREIFTVLQPHGLGCTA